MLRGQNGEPYGPGFWQAHCGFLDYSGAKFRNVQESLLLAQITGSGSLPSWQAVANGAAPRSVAEFRRKVPLTVYEDYAELLTRMKAGDGGRSYTWAFTQYGPG